MTQGVRTWVEIDSEALRHNAEQFLRFIPADTRLMAVVKSNAYGHGLSTVSKILTGISDFRARGWFGVDSLVEGLRLRREGIKNPILVLGYTLPARMREAAKEKIALTISNPESLKAIVELRTRPAIHIKIDTGMHRQGFLPKDIPGVLKVLKRAKIAPQGVYTHFASAKDSEDPHYTQRQYAEFQKSILALEQAGFRNLICHAAATGGALLFPEMHLDMVRVGMGLYGYWPSPESKKKQRELGIVLKPALAWKTIIAEVKEIPEGSYIGYDGTEVVSKRTIIAVLPIGYWHGYDRGFSKIGEVLVRGRRARVLGRISMDMTVIDVTDIPRVRVGDEVVLIGAQDKGAIWADELALKIGTTAYEFLTRINPLIKRIVVEKSSLVK